MPRSIKPVEDGPLGRLLGEVVRHVAHHPIRARGTFCGSIAHADPASEWCAVAAALDAEMVAESKRSGLRVIAAKDFFQGIMTTALREDELLDRGAAADPAAPARISALPSSAAAPATSPSPWRLAAIG